MRVDLAEGSAVELFILPDLAKRLAGEGGRCRGVYCDPCNARIRRRCGPDQREKPQCGGAAWVAKQSAFLHGVLLNFRHRIELGDGVGPPQRRELWR
jgi:hypothetical protein